MKKNEKDIGKELCYLLRHSKGIIDIDRHGYASMDSVMKQLDIEYDELLDIVEKDDKNRYHINGRYIRANQGHSIDVDLSLKEQIPPDKLYHGSSTKSLNSILENGILKMSRNHVHLSLDIETATSVGTIHGRVVLFLIDAKKMYSDGQIFYLSENGVWLTDNIDKKYITVLDY